MSETSSKSKPTSVAVDIMGGDFAPDAIIDGVGRFLDEHGDRCKLLLVGDEKVMESGLRRIDKFGDSRIELVHASQVVEMGEHPIAAIRHKRDSSINVGMRLVKEGRAGGIFSAGSTGAAVGAAYFTLRMLDGVDRPGIAATLPSEKGRFLVVDAGASVDCSPENLLHYAVMGSVYAEKVMHLENPRVGLMSNGTEEGKGNRLTQGAFPLLSAVQGMNFIGNCEGHDLYSGGVDVLVCDGFVGNVVLKCAEQLAKSMSALIKRSVMRKLLWKIGGLMMKGAMKDVKKAMDYSEFGGAPLLGVRGVVIIGHGISDAKATSNGIKAVVEAIEQDVTGIITEKIGQLKPSAAVNGGSI